MTAATMKRVGERSMGGVHHNGGFPHHSSFEPGVQEKLRQSVPRKRIGRPDDIARAVLFFADPANDYLTGQLIYVCGGRSLASPSV